jgi:hypothetical protein
MAEVALALFLLGGVCGVLGILAALEIVPAFIQAVLVLGPVAATTAFFWGLAGLLVLTSIAAGVISLSRRQ